MHQEYSLSHRKSTPKFEIGALFRQVMLYTDTQKKTHHCKINTLLISNSSLCSESETLLGILI